MARVSVSNERDRVLLPLLLLLVSAPSTAGNSGKADAQPPGAATGTAVPGAAGLEVPWTSSWEEAVKAARQIPDGRILIYFGDDDCGACRRMEALVIPSTSFWAFTRDKVPLYLKLGSEEGKALGAKLRVREAPTWVVVTPDLLVCGGQAGPTTQMGWVETFARSEASWVGYRRLLEKEKQDPADLQVVFDVARETFRRGGDPIAEPRFERLSNDPDCPPDLREKSLAYIASIELDAGRPERADGYLDRLLAVGKDPVLKQRAQLRKADIEISRGRKDLAIARLRAFKKEWPASPLVAEADALLQALTGTAAAEGIR
jgi:hypothetical protein